MINLTKIYCGAGSASDALRYGQGHAAPSSASTRRPIVVWTMSRHCNLHCIHCFADSEDRVYPGELTVPEAIRMMDDVAQFRIPALLLSAASPGLSVV